MKTICPTCGNWYENDGFRVAQAEGALYVEGVEILAPQLTLKVAQALADAAGSPVSAKQISETVFGREVPDITVRQHVLKLRDLLMPTRWHIVTQYGLGYRLRKTA